MVSPSHLERILLWERSNLFESHWSNQWLTPRVNYLSEAVHGEQIEIRREETGPEEFTHAILEAASNREVLRARTVWRHS